MSREDIHRSQPRSDVQISLPDGSTWAAPVGTRLESILRVALPASFPGGNQPCIVAAVVDHELEELSVPLTRDARVRPLTIAENDGARIYRRSLAFLLLVAAAERYPERKIQVSHSLPYGGYYGWVSVGKPFSEAEISLLEAHMRQIVDANEPIVRKITPVHEALRVFQVEGDDDKIRLLRSRRERSEVPLYHLRGVESYFYGYMTPSTGYLESFALEADGDGFILRYPRRGSWDRLSEPYALPKLRSVFAQTARWLEVLGVPDIGALNQANFSGRMPELILAAEALHEGDFAEAADRIVERQPEARLVLIAGPSSSGKTTSAKRLAIQLLAHGLQPVTISLDDYFVPRERTPLDEDGNYDFEHIEALDLPQFREDLLALMRGEEVQLPRFDFRTGQREPGRRLQIHPHNILIAEGIHGLNQRMGEGLPRESIYRLYVSCITTLNIDRHNRVPTTDVRLLRRIVRDAAYRGYSALETLARWPSVRRGESRWIFPYQEHADQMINSALVYELALIGPLAEPLLRQVPYESGHYPEAKRLLSFLDWVEPFEDEDLVPANSILREFIGDGVLEDYLPGEFDSHLG